MLLRHQKPNAPILKFAGIGPHLVPRCSLHPKRIIKTKNLRTKI
jgi:hypothetical protein